MPESYDTEPFAKKPKARRQWASKAQVSMSGKQRRRNQKKRRMRAKGTL